MAAEGDEEERRHRRSAARPGVASGSCVCCLHLPGPGPKCVALSPLRSGVRHNPQNQWPQFQQPMWLLLFNLNTYWPQVLRFSVQSVLRPSRAAECTRTGQTLTWFRRAGSTCAASATIASGGSSFSRIWYHSSSSVISSKSLHSPFWKCEYPAICRPHCEEEGFSNQQPAITAWGPRQTGPPRRGGPRRPFATDKPL